MRKKKDDDIKITFTKCMYRHNKINKSIIKRSKPLRLLNLLRCRPLRWLHFQDSSNKIDKLLIFYLFELDLSPVDKSLQLIIGFCFKRVSSFCQCVYHYSIRPHISFLPLVLFATDHFRSHVVRSSANYC